ncbi:MAG: TraB/GumN family protein [Bacteroidaceae bacterium]|nr:TraB/GumN family protein [Bacteroidaceae bacterium]
MKPHPKALFAFFVLFVAVSQRSALAVTPADTIPDGIFFRISGGGLAEPSYILGSLHTIPGDFVHHIPHFDEAAASVRQFVFEKDLRRAFQQTGVLQQLDSLTEKTIAQRADSLFRYDGADADHNPYADELDAATYRLVFRTMTEDFNLPDFYRNSPPRNITLLQKQYPAAVGRITAEMGVPLRATGCPLDLYVADSIARPRGVVICDLDTTWVLGSPDSTLTKFLADEAASLHDRHFYAASFFTPAVYYYSLMLNITRTSCANYFQYRGRALMQPMQSELEQRIFAERNALWMRRLPALLQEAPSLVVVGLGHLFDRAGTPGLLHSLRDLGYTIETMAGPSGSREQSYTPYGHHHSKLFKKK